MRNVRIKQERLSCEVWKSAYLGADKTTRKQLLDIALDARKNELHFLWQRSNFFWVFTGAALTVFVGLENKRPLAALALSCFGFIASFSWTLLNRGSKYWYESWERKLELASRLDLWFIPAKVESQNWLSAKRFSPSKLIIGVSDYIALFWTGTIIYQTIYVIHIFLPDEYRLPPHPLLMQNGRLDLGLIKCLLAGFIILFTLGYAFFILKTSETRNPSKSYTALDKEIQNLFERYKFEALEFEDIKTALDDLALPDDEVRELLKRAGAKLLENEDDRWILKRHLNSFKTKGKSSVRHATGVKSK